MRTLRRPIAIVRILMGVLFVVEGASKLGNADFIYGGLMQAVEAAGRAFPFYESFLYNSVETHQTVFTYAVAVGELLLGLSLVSGACVSLSSVAGAFMIVNYALATCYGEAGRLTLHLAMAAVLLALGRMGAGLTWGMDRWLVRKSRSALWLLPLRRTVPAFQKS